MVGEVYRGWYLICIHGLNVLTVPPQHTVRLIAFDRLAAYLEVDVPVKLGGGDDSGKAPSSSLGAKRPPSDSAPDEASEEKRAKPQ